jgi:hypothetical protein
MIDDVWDSFAEAVELHQSRRPMRRPRNPDLDACESTIGCKLPTSYKSFVKRFGAGSLRLDGGPCEWDVWAPGNPKNRFNSSLEHRNASRISSPADWEGHVPDPERAARLVYFAESPLSLDEYGWDPDDPTDPGLNEYGIYAVNGRYPLDQMPRLAHSFYDFIMGYCLERYPIERGYTARPEWKKFGDMREYHRH